MTDHYHSVDLVFRNGLRDYEVLPPDDVWDDVRKSIPERKKRIYAILPIAASTALVISIAGAAIFLLTTKLSDQIRKIPALTFNQDIIPEEHYTRPVISSINISESSISGNEKQPEIIDETEFHSPVNRIAEETELQEKNLKEIFKGDVTNVKITLPKFSYFGEKMEAEKYSIKNTPTDNYLNFAERWSMGAAMMPSYYSKFYAGKDKSGKEFVSNESTVFSYSGGLSFSFEISERVSLISGFFYNSIGQRIDGISSFSGFIKYADTKSSGDFMVKTSAGSINSTNKDIYLLDISGSRVVTQYNLDVFDPIKANLSYIGNNVIQNMNYLTFPLLMKYKLIDRKIDLNMLGGISYGILINNSSYITSGGVKYILGKTNGLSQITFSSEIGMGVEYKLSEKFTFNLEPLLRYYLTPIGVTTGTNIHPYSFGILSGVFYNF